MVHGNLWKTAKRGIMAAFAAAVLWGGEARAEALSEAALVETETQNFTETGTEASEETEMFAGTATEVFSETQTEAATEILTEAYTESALQTELETAAGTENVEGETATEIVWAQELPDEETDTETQETSACSCGTDAVNAWTHSWDCAVFSAAFRMVCTCGEESAYPFLHDDSCEGYLKAMGAVCTCDMQEDCGGEAPYIYHEEDCGAIDRIRALLCDCGAETNDPEEHDGACAYREFLLGQDYEDEILLAAVSGTTPASIDSMNDLTYSKGALLMKNGVMHGVSDTFTKSGETYYSITNTSYSDSIYATYLNGAMYDGEYLDVAAYFRTGSRTGYAMGVRLTSTMTQFAADRPDANLNSDHRNEIFIKLYFYTAGHCGDSNYLRTFYGLTQINDLDWASADGSTNGVERGESWRVASSLGYTWYGTSDTVLKLVSTASGYTWISGTNGNKDNETTAYQDKKRCWLTFGGDGSTPLELVYDARQSGWASSLGGNTVTISYAYTSNSAQPSDVTLPAAQIISKRGSYQSRDVGLAAGYEVSAWYVSADESSSIEGTGTEYNQVTSDKTHYVYYWTKGYTITYAYMDGSAQPSGVTLPAQESHAYLSQYTLADVPQADGYTATAWMNADWSAADVSGTMPNYDFTVYVYYQADPDGPAKGFDGSSTTAEKIISDRDTQFTFSIFQEIEAADAAGFKAVLVGMADTLNECMEFVSGKAYVNGTEVAASFSYSEETNYVSCYMDGNAAGNGAAAAVRWDLTCKIKEDADLSAYADADDPSWYILPNTAATDLTLAGGRYYKWDTNTVTVKVHTPGVNLTVKKFNSVTGETVAGAEFTVYEWDGGAYSKTVGTMTYQEEEGLYKMEDLRRTSENQGKFKAVETVTPEGFVGAWEKEITVSEDAAGEDLDVALEAVNDMPTGVIIITKKAKGSGELLAGGVYEITALEDVLSPGGQVLMEKGAVADTVTTADDGTATSVKLYPGRYLVTETKAPAGYALDADPQEVAVSYVDKDTAEKDYPLTFVNDRLYADVTLTKVLDAEDIVWAHGNPTFTFRIAGTDVLNEEHTYYGTVEFTSDNTTAESGKVTLSAAFRVLAGSYTVTEEKVMRYTLEAISDVQNGSVSGQTAILDLKEGQAGAATFYNVKSNDEDGGHTAFVKNHIGA